MLGALHGTTVTVETTISPAITLNVGEQLEAEQGPLTRLLRPRVTVRSNGLVLYQAAPAGAPEAAPWRPLLLVALAIGAAYLLLR